ncbi:hypothetical protein BDK51DRAFT_31566 [Blyttiomyces helicus]|uniref:Uncharacterized protein n=1 Tax=Blyttiomyces helicus TaxID=388810 RepID=A0A4P9WMQ8_9FUNG|nr:hypothetical protein BDK51DRAFT_31566 [Blyttiomyces helicus]|eukprot:RKO94204.1 hypothetical protein BDK51DRAFT_31566 [Blyttiomyces helicus]
MKQKLYDSFNDLELDVTQENILVLKLSNDFKTSFHVVIRGSWITKMLQFGIIFSAFEWLHEHRKEGMEDLQEWKILNLKQTEKLFKKNEKLQKALKNTSAIDKQLIVKEIENFYRHELVGQTQTNHLNSNKHADINMKDSSSDNNGRLQVGQPRFVWWGIGAAIHRVIHKSQSTEPSKRNNDLDRIGFDISAEWSRHSSNRKNG